jgi:orotidine-5'-phosphate decarboxylase
VVEGFNIISNPRVFFILRVLAITQNAYICTIRFHGGSQFLGPFETRLSEISKQKKSRVILALDTIKSREFDLEQARSFVQSVERYIVGVKLGLPAFANLCQETKRLIQSFPELPFIADWKLADVPHTNRLVTQKLLKLGFSATIVHAVVGEDSLKEVKSVADEHSAGVVGVVAMSNSGASTLNSLFDTLLQKCVRAGIKCFIAPATFPDIIRKIKQSVEECVVLSPGVGAQGGDSKLAVSAGADFLIIGRSITDSENPEKQAQLEAQNSWR